MICISVIRNLTDEDVTKIETRAVAFAARHNIDTNGLNAWDAVSYAVETDARLNALWSRVLARALREPVGVVVAFGKVGFRV